MSAPGSERLAARSNFVSPRVATSVLSTDLALLAREVRAAVRAGADWVHVDVMDDSPVRAERPEVPRGGAVLDVHLLVRPTEAVVRAVARAGADIVSFHPEESDCVRRTVGLVKAQGCRVGLALSASTPLAELDEVLGDLDAVVVTSLGTGPGADAAALSRIRAACDRVSATGRRTVLEVDGGVRPENVEALVRAGADVLVACPAFLGSRGCAAALAALGDLRARPAFGAAAGGLA